MSLVNILSKNEEKKFYTLQIFSREKKEHFFQLPNTLLEDVVFSFELDENKIIFILLFGYFKAANRFYSLEEYPENDISYISKKYNFTHDKKFNIATRTLQRYQVIIKDYLGFNNYTQDITDALQNEAINLANNFTNRKKIFFALVDLSMKLKIETPSHTELSRIITKALNTQKKDILKKLDTYKDDKKLKVLDSFLEKDTDNQNRYNLSYFRRLEHSTNKNQMLLSINKLNTIKSKFITVNDILNKITLTPKIAEYYARWIEKGKTSQLTQTNIANQQFTLLSFTYYQYLIRNDNLIDRFISIIQTAKNSSLRDQKEFSYEQEPQKNLVIKSLEEANTATLNEIEYVIKDNNLSAVKKVLAIELLVEKRSKVLGNILVQKKLFESALDKRYDFIEKKSVSLQGKLSGVLKETEFDEKSSNKNIILAIKYFKTTTNFTSKAPYGFLDEDEKIAIFDQGKFRISLYKVLLFFHVSDAIKNGTLNLKYSYRYKNFEDYLITKDEWTSNKDTFLKVYELENIKNFDTFIEPIKKKLELSFKITNDNINNGFNTYFTATDDSYILKTPKVEKNENEESISKYLPQSEYLSVIDLLNSINDQVDFLSSFQHYTQSKAKANHNLLLAAILGYGCNLSLSKMGKISKGINENQLDNTKIWYFSEDNTNEANDKVIAFMDTLDIVKLMRKDKEINHTSSDGQKFNISSSLDSTNAGYSFKYFGTSKGVVSNGFIDESFRLFHAEVISVSERESGYVIDGLLHNETVKSDIHSTDTAGVSELIFGVVNILGKSFAPRIKNFKSQQLYSCKNSPKYYHNLNYKLIPKRRINETIIKENWDNILRFIVTIKSRKTTATQLLKRLTSYSKQHKLYRALKEYGRIIKTDFLLYYIDNVEFRQSIEKQLNKMEASNKFSKAVFFGNNQEFQVATVEEQNIANNSKRLIQNCIILWNYMYMTKKLQDAKSQVEKDEIINTLKRSSILHWKFINFFGEYDFTRSSKKVSRLIALNEPKGFINSKP